MWNLRQAGRAHLGEWPRPYGLPSLPLNFIWRRLMPKRMWCRIVSTGKALAFGYTADDESVAVRISDFKHIGGLEHGDIVAFEPLPFVPDKPWEHRLGPPKLFGLLPRLIGEAPQVKYSPAHAGEVVQDAAEI